MPSLGWNLTAIYANYVCRDLKCIVKLVSGVLILRKGNAAEWTSDMDSQLISWVNQYVSWLQTSTIALQEAAATK